MSRSDMVALKSVSVISAFVLNSLLASTALAEEGRKWAPHLEIGGKFSKHRNIGETNIFVPLFQNNETLVFGDVRGRFDNDSSQELNVGVGARYLWESTLIFGAYGFYDHRNSPLGNKFNQITLGAEVLTEHFDLRGNLYLPFGKTSYSELSASAAQLSGSSILFQEGAENALKGFDAEVGVKVPWANLTKDGSDALRLYAGGYNFWDKGVESVYGPRFRAEYSINDIITPGSRLSFNAEYQYDDVRGAQTFVGARLRLPLSTFTESEASKLTPLEQRMTETIVRDVDIVSSVGAYGATSVGVDADSGADLSNLNVVAAQDEVSLQSGLDAAEAGQITVLTGGASKIDVAATISLNEGQSVGSTFEVMNPHTKQVVVFGETVEVHGTDSSLDVFEMHNNTKLENLKISGGRHAVNADGKNNVSLENVEITGTTGSAVNVMNGTGLSMSNIVMSEIGFKDTVGFQNGDPNNKVNGVGVRLYKVSDVDIENLDMTEVSMGTMFNNVRDVEIDGYSLHSSKYEGLLFHNVVGADLKNITIENNGKDALAFVVSGDISVKNASIKHLSDFNPDPADGWASGVNVTDYSGDPELGYPFPDGVNQNYTFEDVTIEGMNGHGMYLQGVSDVTLKNVDLLNVAQYGLFLGGFPGLTDVSLDDVVIDGAGQNGMYLAMMQLKNFNGDLTIKNTPSKCQPPFWGSDFLSQDPGNEFRVNGEVVTEAMFATTDSLAEFCK
ncbi:inverse autotransporter beta domain-containing protein [Pseudovibrio denitrificans]|uniref:inverse autotransporter beta domain-containing protein n=1 Tax=Pseudovibrio denitrificans TaxID=258256 RepID=UPI0039BF04EF